MKWTGAALFALLTMAATPAVAANPVYDISHTDTITGAWESLDVAGYADGGVPAVGILFSTTATSPTDPHDTFLVLCDDLFQYVYVPRDYAPGTEQFTAQTLNGNTYYIDSSLHTRTFSLEQASLVGLLVGQAQTIWNGGSATPGQQPNALNGLGLNEFQAIAAIQGALWSIEYDTSVTSLNPDSTTRDNITAGIESLIDQFEDSNGKLKLYSNDALGLYSSNGTQDQVLGIPEQPEGNGTPLGGLPEPADWALMLLGVFGAGGMMRRARAQQPRVAAAT